MDIRFISSLTDHDEDRFAPIVLRALADLLSKIPVTYVVRIETADGRIFQRSRIGPEPTRSTSTRSTSTRRDDSDPCRLQTWWEKGEDGGS